MELTYRLTRDDYHQCGTLAARRVVRQAKVALGPVFLLLSVLVTLAVLIWVTANHHFDERAVFLVAWLAHVWGLFSLGLGDWIARRQYRADRLADDSYSLGELHLTMDSDGIVASDAAKTTRYSWRAFSEVSEHRGLILLWCDRAQCVVVPARALADDSARRDFVTLARQRIAQTAAQPVGRIGEA